MALANILMLSQIAGHVILAILSLLVIIPMSMNFHEFNGNCILVRNTFSYYLKSSSAYHKKSSFSINANEWENGNLDIVMNGMNF